MGKLAVYAAASRQFMLYSLSVQLATLHLALNLHLSASVVKIAQADDDTISHHSRSNHTLPLNLHCQSTHSPHIHGDIKTLLSLQCFDAKSVGAVEQEVLKQSGK
jgi:hypothetical protein